jgi:predicted phosphate transport protein (TIGR00153 family)
LRRWHVRFPFIPREEKFFDLFEESARNLVRGAGLLAELIRKWENIEEKAREISELEHHGDNITHRIIAQLHATFVTPIDREDIAQLAERMDDVMDFIEGAAVAMLIYEVKRPTERAQELADILVRTTSEVSAALPRLRRRNQLNKIPEHCIEINRLENEADRVVRAALTELFHDQVDLADVIKWREIYEHMETATDRCEDIANVLEGVMIKRA